MAINLNEMYQRKVDKLVNWRNRYTKEEYSSKVVLNIFYDIYPTFLIWNKISNFFSDKFLSSQKIDFNDYSSAVKYIYDLINYTRLNDVRPNLNTLLEKNNRIGTLNYNDFKSLISSARSGSNESVENIEYSYIYYTMVNELILMWAACGLIKLNKNDAYLEITGMVIGVIELNSFYHVMEAFIQPVGIYLSGGYQTSGENASYFGAYEKLPALW